MHWCIKYRPLNLEIWLCAKLWSTEFDQSNIAPIWWVISWCWHNFPKLLCICIENFMQFHEKVSAIYIDDFFFWYCHNICFLLFQFIVNKLVNNGCQKKPKNDNKWRKKWWNVKAIFLGITFWRTRILSLFWIRWSNSKQIQFSSESNPPPSRKVILIFYCEFIHVLLLVWKS